MLDFIKFVFRVITIMLVLYFIVAVLVSTVLIPFSLLDYISTTYGSICAVLFLLFVVCIWFAGIVWLIDKT